MSADGGTDTGGDDGADAPDAPDAAVTLDSARAAA